MRGISFNKQEDTVLCIKCRVHRVPARKWDTPCEVCKGEEEDQQIKAGKDVSVGKRMPAAVIKTEDGREIVVDKFGKEVSDHGYDLKNDPKGWKKVGRIKNTKIII